MPRVIDLADDRPASLAECVDALAASGFDPGDEESLHHAAGWLRRNTARRRAVSSRGSQGLAR